MSGDGRHEERRDPHGEHEPGGEHEPSGAAAGGEEPRGDHGDEPPGREAAEQDGSERDTEQDLLGPDEQALRLLMHDAVRGVEPSADALDRLHRAVPARRARRRQMTVGAVAAALVVGVAAPVLTQSGVVARVMDGDTANTASSHRQEESGGSGADGDATGRGSDRKFGTGDGTDDPSEPSDSSGADSSAGPESNDTLGPTSPSCLRSQLGDGGSGAEPADANGHVYGSFRVVNISDSSCRVEGPDTVSATATGGADPSGISVVHHTPGDRASRLPDPATEPTSIILAPGQSYVVRFAWVPNGEGAGSCRAPGPAPTPGDGGSGGATTTGGGTGSGGAGGSGDTSGGGTTTGGGKIGRAHV